MKTILIAEDEKAYVTLLQKKLSLAYTVYTANDGQKALDIAREIDPDLILLDIRMPIMDGMTVLKELRKTETGKNTKVIFLTNYEANDSIINEIVEELPTYYLVKSDIKLDDLMAKVAEVLKDDGSVKR